MNRWIFSGWAGCIGALWSRKYAEDVFPLPPDLIACITASFTPKELEQARFVSNSFRHGCALNVGQLLAEDGWLPAAAWRAFPRARRLHIVKWNAGCRGRQAQQARGKRVHRQLCGQHCTWLEAVRQTLQAAPAARLDGITITGLSCGTEQHTGDRLVETLCQAPIAGTLKQLHLDAPISPAAAAQLLRYMPQLTDLSITIDNTLAVPAASAASAPAAASDATKGPTFPPQGHRCVLTRLKLTVLGTADFICTAGLAQLFANLTELHLDTDGCDETTLLPLAKHQQLSALFQGCRHLRKLTWQAVLTDRLPDGQYLANKLLASLPELQELVMRNSCCDLEVLLAAGQLRRAVLDVVETDPAQLQEAVEAGAAAEQLEVLELGDVWVRLPDAGSWRLYEQNAWSPERGCLARLLPALQHLGFSWRPTLRSRHLTLLQLATAVAGHSSLTSLQAYLLPSSTEEWLQSTHSSEGNSSAGSLQTALAECPLLQHIGVATAECIRSKHAWYCPSLHDGSFRTTLARPMPDGRLRNLCLLPRAHECSDIYKDFYRAPLSLAQAARLLDPGVTGGRERDVLSLPLTLFLDVKELQARVQQLGKAKLQRAGCQQAESHEAEPRRRLGGSQVSHGVDMRGSSCAAEMGGGFGELVALRQSSLREHIGDMLAAQEVLLALQQEMRRFISGLSWRGLSYYRGWLAWGWKWVQMQRRATAIVQEVEEQCGEDSMQPLPDDWRQQLQQALVLRQQVHREMCLLARAKRSLRPELCACHHWHLEMRGMVRGCKVLAVVLWWPGTSYPWKVKMGRFRVVRRP